MIFTGGILGNASGAGLVVLPLVSASLLLYQMGVLKGPSSSGNGNAVERIDVPTHLRGVDSDSNSVYGDVPECARDVFVDLRREGGSGGGGRDGRACRGLLVRDDVVITSKECSTRDFAFDFAGVGVVRARPHASLNAKGEVADSRLGFLEARPPPHYHFVDRPVRRTRMFLSDRPYPRVDGTESEKAVMMTCGDEGQPIAHGFPSDDGEMVPLAELAGVVPEDVLWEGRDLSTAPALQYKSHRWWTRRIARDDEERTIAELSDAYDGPPGSASLLGAKPDALEQTSAVLEAVDPRGHRNCFCFQDYYERWRLEKPFSGLHFFDWLDFGLGRRVLLKSTNVTYREEVPPYGEGCEKRLFNKDKVHYFDDGMRRAHEIYFEPSEDGTRLIARYEESGEPVPPSHTGNPHLYMWSLDKKWYVVDDRWDEGTYGEVKHSGVVAGRAALSGGKAYFDEGGAVWGINFSSGHYRPEVRAAAMMHRWMKDRGFNLTAFRWVGRNGWSTDDCGRTDWEEIAIPGFAAAALNQSCHEVTTSPTWMLKGDV